MSGAYDQDDIYGIEGEEQMVAFKPRATPESSPDPIGKPVSPPVQKSAENAKVRRKALPSKGDAYLLRIAHPNYPEVHRKAETHLPKAESDDESMEDIADMDERLAKEMMLKEKSAQQKPEPPRFESRVEEYQRAVGEDEEEMVDVDEHSSGDMEVSDADDEDIPPDQVSRDMKRLAVDATHALHRLDLSSPEVKQQTLFVVPDPIDADRRESSSTATTATTATTAPSRKPSDGLGIFTPITPVEPNFQNSDPFSQWSPLAQHRGSMSSPGGKIPAILSIPGSPEASNSPLTQLPSARELLEIANRTNEAQHRDRHASLSSLSMPSPPPHSAYRASFSNAHPSPSMTSEPRSSLVLSPPSGVLRRESYPLPSSASTISQSIASPSEAASPHPLLTPQSPEHRQSIDETAIARTLPPLPGIGRPSISVATIPAAGSGGYKCDFPGCTAAPFQTSYLLK